jgi:hypothetical protein
MRAYFGTFFAENSAEHFPLKMLWKFGIFRGKKSFEKLVFPRNSQEHFPLKMLFKIGIFRGKKSSEKLGFP